MIRASYEEMESAATKIGAAGGEYKTNVDALYSEVEKLKDVWDGVDNQKYVATVNSYKEDLRALGDVVEKYASFLNKTSQVIKETQEGISTAAGRL